MSVVETRDRGDFNPAFGIIAMRRVAWARSVDQDKIGGMADDHRSYRQQQTGYH